MNLHFLSFLMDIASWILFGFVYGKYIQRFKIFKGKSKNIVALKISFAALIGGLIATVERALPAYGFAIYHFAFASVFALIYSTHYMRPLRRHIIRRSKLFMKFIYFSMRKQYVRNRAYSKQATQS